MGNEGGIAEGSYCPSSCHWTGPESSEGRDRCGPAAAWEVPWSAFSGQGPEEGPWGQLPPWGTGPPYPQRQEGRVCPTGPPPSPWVSVSACGPARLSVGCKGKRRRSRAQNCPFIAPSHRGRMGLRTQVPRCAWGLGGCPVWLVFSGQSGVCSQRGCCDSVQLGGRGGCTPRATCPCPHLGGSRRKLSRREKAPY